MKMQNKVRQGMGRLLLLVIFVVIGATIVHAQGQENLLRNPGFEGGHYNQDGISEITVPREWRLHWLDDVEFAGSNGVAYRPESVVWNISGAPPNEKDLFWRDGIYTLKVFKGYAPMYAALSQDVSGLQVGRRYRLVAPIFADIVEDYDDGQKIAPGKLDSGFVRMGVSPVGARWLDSNAINYGPQWTAGSISPFYLSYQTFSWDFTATHESMTVWIEFGSKDPYLNNGFFMDGLGLYALDEIDSSVNAPAAQAAAQPAGPTPTPQPTPTPRADGSIVHVVQSGDTFWTIAIEYASAIDMTPEEALPHIRELNNDPAFINAGQELLIKPPSETVAEAAPAEPTPEAEEAETAAETATETEAGEEGATEAETADPPPEDSETETTAETTAAEETAVAGDTTPGKVCVSAFDDQNGDGAHDSGSENLLADAAIALSHGGNTVATYVSDGVNANYCFESLEAGTYQVQFFPPADYVPTTPENWAVAVSDGQSFPFTFGAQFDPTAVAASDAQPQSEEEALLPAVSLSEEAVDTADAASGGAGTLVEPDGLMSNVGIIIIGIAILLILLAGVGIVLLRRG